MACISAERVPWVLFRRRQPKNISTGASAGFPCMAVSCGTYGSRLRHTAVLPLENDHDHEGERQGDHDRINRGPRGSKQRDLTEDCLAEAQGFCFCRMDERGPEKPDQGATEHAG